MMSNAHPAFGRLAAGFAGVLLGLSAGLSPVTATADDIVYVEGVSTSTESGFQQQAASYVDREQICSPQGIEAISDRVNNIDEHIRYELANVDPDLQLPYNTLSANSQELLGPAVETLCSDDDPFQVNFFKIVYATCRMTMRDGSTTLDVRFPPGQEEGVMEIINHETQEAIVTPVIFTRLLNQETGVLQGNDFDFISNPGAAREVEVAVYPNQTLTLTGREYTFNFNFKLDLMRSLMGLGESLGMTAEGGAAGASAAEMDAMMEMIGGAATIASSGTALVAADAPGLDIIRTFYQNFAAAMEAGQGSLLSGLYNHRLLEKGMPVEMQQTTEIVMGGGFMGFGGMAPQRSETDTTITRIVAPLTTNYSYCDGSYVPAGYTATNPLSEVTSSTSPGGGGQGVAANGAANGSAPPDVTEAMSAAQDAMNSMTPEERAAMEQFSGSFGQLLGGALGGGAAGAGQTGRGIPAAGQAPPTAAPARSGSSLSSALMTDNLTQSAQNMLQALGYDPGNTDGELGIETTIAISQFQAEQGLEATGEVTPQLLGVLAAAVDAL